MMTVNALGLTVMLVLLVSPIDSLHGPGDQKSHKSSDMPKSEWSGQATYYLLAALVIVVLQFFLIGYCSRIQKTSCYKRLRNKIQGVLGNTENREQSGDNSPPAYSDIITEDMQIVVIKSPPYVKDPPSYSEAVGTNRANFTESIYI